MLMREERNAAHYTFKLHCPSSLGLSSRASSHQPSYPLLLPISKLIHSTLIHYKGSLTLSGLTNSQTRGLLHDPPRGTTP